MIEILSIFSQFIIFLLIFSFPFNKMAFSNVLKINKSSINFLDVHALNLIFFIYISLFFSLLNIELGFFFLFYLIFSVIFLIYNLIKNLNPSNFQNKIFLIFSIITLSIFFYLSQNLRLEWDGQFWLEKALFFFNGNKIEDLKNLQMFNYYPHLGGYLWGFFWKNSLVQLEYFGRFFYVYFYVFSIFYIFNIIEFKNVYLKILLIIFFILLTFEPYLFGGYQEYLLFSTLIISSRFICFLEFKKPNSNLVILIILTLFLLCWFKDEGVVYYLMFSSILIILTKSPFHQKIIFFILMFALLIAQIIIENNLIGIYDFPHKNSIPGIIHDILNLKILATKLTKIFFHIGISFAKHPIWLFIILSIIFLKIISNTNSKLNNYFLFCFVLNFIFIVGIFFTFKQFDFMLRVSLDRLLFQTSGFYMCLLIYSIQKLNFNIKK